MTQKDRPVAVINCQERPQPTGKEHGVRCAQFANAAKALRCQHQPRGSRIGVHVSIQATSDKMHASKLLQYVDSNISQSNPKQPICRIPIHASK